MRCLRSEFKHDVKGNPLTLRFPFAVVLALQKKPEDINRRSADMWSFAVLLWELVTREVPFADLSHMEIGMKVS